MEIPSFMQQLRLALPKVTVDGIPTIERVVISKKPDSENYILYIEGTDLMSVMVTDGIVSSQVISNSINEVEKVLGIEAARSTIIDEIKYVMGSYEINIDNRHLMLLADYMTFMGEVLGITRFDIAKIKESTLMHASFENTADQLFYAALHGITDKIEGVSECIIVGAPIPMGTGLVRIYHHPI